MIDLVVIGGGAAGLFGAINAARRGVKVTLLEGTRRPLTKVRISGGGRCNVTHHCFEPAELVKAYPRGAKELRGAFARFGPRETVAWFLEHGIELKTEADGRMFPVTDDSATIADCLLREANKSGVSLQLGAIVESVTATSQGSFKLKLRGSDECLESRYVLLATGGMTGGHALAQALGHTIEAAIPSLFTFNISDARLAGLAGLSVPQARLRLTVGDDKQKFESQGPLLITHWGLSGPSVLRLSAFAAIELFYLKYQAELRLSWVGLRQHAELVEAMWRQKGAHPKRVMSNDPLFDLPRRLWQRCLASVGLNEALIWADASKAQILAIANELSDACYKVEGKGVFKEEFVTAGGVCRKEIDFRTMESRICKGLFCAGEVLDIDGITGGFNFQNAWTTSWIAAQEIARRSLSTDK